jgi:LEA14-like dessication related protein
LALQNKIIVYAAIAGLFGMMGVIIWYASLDNSDLEQVEIKLLNVEVKDVNKIENSVKLEVTFLVKNPSEKTFTVPIISYQLYADGQLLGSGQYSTEDISMPGRALFLSGVEIPLKNTFILNESDVNSEIYQAVLNGNISSFSAEGSITTQTSWSSGEKVFKTST